ncbi:RebB family R body protein [Nitrospirillum sp. BR 11163]|uniref:RebB family R body protein n=1 Tax=Nitrospirillum sp. BR 11163 TaxID=3104323 RepID=UPI002AFDCB03|nr:RebB family R body protein [Nitrospirillum sp. BR 11163]MEA1672212.1 RebB family R body protein [Nitrospirillum sp. BR 11163]
MAGIKGPLSAVANATVLEIGTAPSLAMAMTYTAMADSIGLAMENAVANQQRGQVLAEAALAQVLTFIIAKGATGK